MSILDELQKLEAAATVAPWEVRQVTGDYGDWEYSEIQHTYRDGGIEWANQILGTVDLDEADAELIVSMRNNLPKLIAALWRVAARHQPELVLMAPKEPKLLCAECRTAFPCDTRQEMDKELEGE